MLLQPLAATKVGQIIGSVSLHVVVCVVVEVVVVVEFVVAMVVVVLVVVVVVTVDVVDSVAFLQHHTKYMVLERFNFFDEFTCAC